MAYGGSNGGPAPDGTQKRPAGGGLFSPGGRESLLGFDLAFGEALAGLDEAGRGPLAGPLVAAAAVLDLGSTYPGVDDSKKLSPEARGRAALLIKERAVAWAVAAKTPAEVDSLNPLMASMLAMAEAFSSLPAKPGLALADGNAAPPVSGARVVTVVRGDARSLSIAAASILAKTARDAMMEELDRLYPLYGFARHKGYGTREHLEAIARHGPSPAHRLSFRGAGGPAGPKGPSGSKGRGGAGGQGGTEGPDGTEWSRGGLF